MLRRYSFVILALSPGWWRHSSCWPNGLIARWSKHLVTCINCAVTRHSMWVSAAYERGTLTLQGFVRTTQLKEEAEAAARRASGIDEIDNQLQVLPAHRGDDDIRIASYIAIFGSSALERYAPGGQLSGLAISELRETARFGLEGTDVGRGPHSIHIIVNGGRILLRGEVRTRGDRQIAEATVRTLPGVLAVVNELRVATPE